MTTTTPSPFPAPTAPPLAAVDPSWRALHEDARRWVRRKRMLYTILGIYGALSLMWFAIDMADGTENLWFYWPMFGSGIAVAITAVVLLGVGGVLGADWERRQIDRYLTSAPSRIPAADPSRSA